MNRSNDNTIIISDNNNFAEDKQNTISCRSGNFLEKKRFNLRRRFFPIDEETFAIETFVADKFLCAQDIKYNASVESYNKIKGDFRQKTNQIQFFCLFF